MAVNITTNSRIYLADSLAARYPATATALTKALTAAGTDVPLLPGTRDIWARDYMPVPTPGGLVQFRYAPDYLRAKRWQHTITDGGSVAQQLGLVVQPNPLVVDGGNVVSGFGRVVMTDKVFRENPNLSPAAVRTALVEALGTERVDFVPADPDDFTGHADGLVHFLDERTVLVNDYRRDPKHSKYWKKLKAALCKAGLDTVPLPYNPFDNPKGEEDSAVGTYLNFVDVGTALIVPVYQMAEDDAALKCLQSLHPNKNIIPVNGEEVAKEGGVFHCITWADDLLPIVSTSFTSSDLDSSFGL